MPDGTFASPRAPRRWRRGFWSLIATQFQGAFNENALKFLIIYLVLALEKDKAQRDRLEFLVGALFAAPFILVSLIDVWSPMKLIRGDRVLWLAVLGNTYFFFVAALLQFNIFLYGQDVLHLDSTHGGFLQAAVAIGIGIGSLVAGFLSGGKIEYGLIPLGALGMTLLGACLAIPGLTFEEVLVLLDGLWVCGG